MGLKDKNVLLGVTGSISAYKACDLVQRLKDEGAHVRVIMTASAAKLVHPNTFAALTGYRVPVDGWSGVESGAMDHIDLARWADVYLVAPCTAHTIAEFAHGLTGSLLSLLYLVYERHAYIAPAMNSVMLDAPAVRRNLATLQAKGDILLPTGEGVLACGEIGYGKLLDVAQIIAYLNTHRALAAPYPALAGKKVLISLGHTREKWDDVRFISNRSSGKTGLALARAFTLSGADVHVVAGHADEPITPGFAVTRVETSAGFQKEMLGRQGAADVVIMAAAIADFVPSQTFRGKRKASKSVEKIELQPFPNILLELGKRKSKGQILVGFALETADALAQAEAKMKERHCDVMVVNNPVADDTGFGRDVVLAGVLSRRPQAASASLQDWDKDQLANTVAAEVQALLTESAETAQAPDPAKKSRAG
ncbi:MAG TPA: bifunctional phosphopantothenoylcysteine decarboxylase/phosphopantothenate--cysteine ligase CoaBC [Fibrobacteria bacterium]|nr:bifunctional phosphopantothenoylcysteine decarboxylase/phosphopantothenate--cysteine ligase CoaBC [Fibrobacteria bacterium]